MADKFLKLANGILVEAGADHGGLAGLGDDDHAQYLHLNKPSQTVLQPFTVNTGANSQGITLLSGNPEYFTALALGRTAIEAYFGVVSVAGGFYANAAPGDFALRSEGAASAIHLGPYSAGTSVVRIAADRVRIGTVLHLGDYQGTWNGAGDLILRRSATTGAIFFGDSDTKYLYYDGAKFLFSDAISVAGTVTISPGSTGAPIVLGANGQGQLVTGLNADQLDGNHATAFAASGHNHDSAYLGITAQAADSHTLDGHHWSEVPAAEPGEGHIFLTFYNYNSQDAGTWNPQIYTSSYLNGNIYNSTHNDADQISWKSYLAAGTYTLRVCYHKDSHSGIVDFYIDSTEVGSVDTYAGTFSGNNLYTVTGITVGTSGLKTIKAKVDGKNASSDNHYAQIVSIALWRTA